MNKIWADNEKIKLPEIARQFVKNIIGYFDKQLFGLQGKNEIYR